MKYFGWQRVSKDARSHETVFCGKSFFKSRPSPHKTSNQRRLLLASPPPPPPSPPHRRRNRCPCGESFVRREFNTPGECSFRAKAAVAVGAATTAIAITSGKSSHQRLHQPSPHCLRRNRDDYDKSGGRRYGGSIDAERVLLGERNCYGRGVARRRNRRGRRQA